MPDAGRTREVLRAEEAAFSRTQATTGQPEQRHSLRNGFTAYTWSPRCAGLLATVASRGRHTRLDPGIGGSGPHDFAVRADAFVRAPKRAEHPHVHRIPLPTSVTIAIRPSRWRRDGRIQS